MKNTLLILAFFAVLSGHAQTDTLSEKFLTDEWLGTSILDDSVYLTIPDAKKCVDSLKPGIAMLIPFIRELDANGKDTLSPTWMIDGYWSGTWKLENDSLVFTDGRDTTLRNAYSVRIIMHDKIELKRTYTVVATGKREDQYMLMERKK